ncbi:hypothetical protein MUA90_09025 [Staphylococcus sp. IVB6181]|uniref:hypothetical protein n=1 Tax=unclassified Staphylococcus TaxID=91994 RepID=UPI000DF7A24A|nr:MULTISPECIES: hypothetical protein [unclassified Staphylococcus]UXV34173.1 hypothetical protein MUA90_09025 [Staphylococcus sp. IVB6181]
MILLKTFIIAFSVFTFLSAILMLTRNPKLPKIVLILLIAGSILLDIGALIAGFVPALIMLIIGLAMIQIGIGIYQKKTFGKVIFLAQSVRFVVSVLIIVFFVVLQ